MSENHSLIIVGHFGAGKKPGAIHAIAHPSIYPPSISWFLTNINACYYSEPCPSIVNESHSLVKSFRPRIH